jgi:hypothetical protein
MTRQRRSGCGGCLLWSLSFWPLAGFIAWPLLVWHGAAGWIVAVVWWIILVVATAAAVAQSRR